MKKEHIQINSIPAIIWGEKSSKVYIAIHGDKSNKEDTVIEILAEKTVEKGYQVLSFDLPENGYRKNENYQRSIQNCISDLREIMDYSQNIWKEINIFGCSTGAYFTLLTYKNELINKALFLSPIVDMLFLIENLMKYSNISPEQLQAAKEFDTPIGKKLYWDYYSFVKTNPIVFWNIKTHILYGSNDNLCDIKTITKFSKKFNCKLEILENGEHFFHTKGQLDYYGNWLEKNIDVIE